MENRPTFFNKSKQPIRAGGVIYYRFNKFSNKIQLLLQQIDKKFEDMGGKTAENDIDINHTIGRELVEETNGIISMDEFYLQVNKYNDCIYSSTGKYLLYILPANEHISSTKLLEYSNKEFYDNVTRTVHWVNLDSLNNIILHKRLIDIKDQIINIFNHL
jgi:hypothetical protein